MPKYSLRWFTQDKFYIPIVYGKAERDAVVTSINGMEARRTNQHITLEFEFDDI